MFLWDVLLERCAWGPKINAFWILLYNVMTSVLSGNASFNISFLFSTPLLATFWPFFRTTTRALSFHLTCFISSITTSDLWEFAEKSNFPETLCIYKTMLANHFQLNPSCHMHNLWRRWLWRMVQNQSLHSISQCNSLTFSPPIQPISAIPLVFYKLHTDIGFWIYDICQKSTKGIEEISSTFRTVDLQLIFNSIYWLCNYTYISPFTCMFQSRKSLKQHAKRTVKCLFCVRKGSRPSLNRMHTHTHN